MAFDFILSDNEKEVTTYRCSELKFPPCTGFLTVTNKRVVFHGVSTSLGNGFLEGLLSSGPGQSANSRIVNEVKIDSISGLNCFYGAKVNFMRAFFGVLVAILSLICFGNSRGTNWMTGRTETKGFMIFLGVALLCLALFILYKCFKRVFSLKIYSTQATGAISIGEGMGGMLGSSAAFSMIASPTPETDLMMRQLGAIIYDIQALGDRGASKWIEHFGTKTT